MLMSNPKTKNFMKNTDLNNYLITSENDNLDFLLTSLAPGKVICLTIRKKKHTLKFLMRLLKVLSQKKVAGLINSNTSIVHQELYLKLNVSQTEDVCTLLKDVEYHINRWVQMYFNPIIVIQDLDSLRLDLDHENEISKTDHESIYSKLKQLALTYNIAIVTCSKDEQEIPETDHAITV
jgi:hypothetical protein